MTALSTAVCTHCGLPAATGAAFCCPGCAAAHATIEAMGLGSYYARRVLDAGVRPLRPEPSESFDPGRWVRVNPDGSAEIDLMVDGLQCGACVWLIESALARIPDVTAGRINLTTRRLHLAWRGGVDEAAGLIGRIEALGYRLVPFDPASLSATGDRTSRQLLRALAVAGFAAGNLMLLSIGIWAGVDQGMGAATRTLMHWISALIALPAIAYAGQPFFRSAWNAVRHGRTNMDVPVSIGVFLVTGMSLAVTMQGGPDTYFDSAATLLFFLLIGRVLDYRARSRARIAAERLIGLAADDVAVIGADGSILRRPQAGVQPGERVLVGMGERIGIDGTVESGCSTLDQSLVTGESLPVDVAPGARVFAGTINLGGALTIRVTAAGQGTLIAECARAIEAAEQGRGRITLLADRVARAYAPAVHATALLTFLYWWLWAGHAWTAALMNATAVLIITCPCALALAVPAVQVIATGRLFRRGILCKSPSALERLAEIDTVVFDKTGTLSEPQLSLVMDPARDPADLDAAARLAVASRHPLARSLAAAARAVVPAEGVTEVPGRGMCLAVPGGEVRLGSREYCEIDQRVPAIGPELWFSRPGRSPVRFEFAERLRGDASATIAALGASRYRLELLSGDREAAVRAVAARLGLAHWHAGIGPMEKLAALQAMGAAGHRVLMVGDGLNDGPALAAAHVSMSPSSAADLSQNTADIVFQGARLDPVRLALRTARRARFIIRENITLALVYNLIMVPIAIAGLVTPWLAAAAMSASSLAVILNSFRAGSETRA